MTDHPGCPHGEGCERFWWACRLIYLAKETAYIRGDIKLDGAVVPDNGTTDRRIGKVVEGCNILHARMCPTVAAWLKEQVAAID